MTLGKRKTYHKILNNEPFPKKRRFYDNSDISFQKEFCFYFF